jgi:hypothetical protein
VRPQTARWAEPTITGDSAAARRGAAAASTTTVSGTRCIVLFGGLCADESGAATVLLDQLVVYKLQGSRTLACTVTPAVGSQAPGPRQGAMLVEQAPGKLLLWGGYGADGRPLNEAYLLDVERLAWRRVYSGIPEALAPAGGQSRSVP